MYFPYLDYGYMVKILSSLFYWVYRIMTDENKKVSNNNNFVVDGTLIIGISTLITYLIGWCYLKGFFNRLGIEINSLNLSVLSVLQTATIPGIIIIAISSYLFFIGAMIQSNPNLLAFLRTMLLPLLFMLTSLGKEYSDIFLRRMLPSFVLPTLIFAVLLAFVYFILHIINKKQHFFSILAFFGVLSFYSLIINIPHTIIDIGSYDAEVLITSNDNTSFELKQDSNISKNKNMSFVTFTNDSFYFVEKQNPAPKSPNIYIIPKDEIRWIRM